MLFRTLTATACVGAVLVLAACSGSPGAAGSAAPTPSDGAASTTAAPGPEQSTAASPSPSSAATLSADACLTGRYALVRFVAVGGGSTYGTGQGGDVTVTFGDGRYTLAGAGKKPVVVVLGGQTGDLTVAGEARGTYLLKGAAATFTAGSATGGGTLEDGNGDRRKITMKQVDSVIGLAGAGTVACTSQAMTITLSAVRLELGRV
jgi:hypothetical protein